MCVISEARESFKLNVLITWYFQTRIFSILNLRQLNPQAGFFQNKTKTAISTASICVNAVPNATPVFVQAPI